MSDSIEAILTEALVQRLATPASFQRGLGYADQSRVGRLDVTATQVRATVRGTASYGVELTAAGGQLWFECSCPVGADGLFCKHCVAVAMTWVEDHGASLPTSDDARGMLDSLSHDELVELLIDHASEDEGLARKLLLMTSQPASGDSVDVPALRGLIDQAFATHGFVHYRDMYDYVGGVQSTIDALAALTDEAQGNDLIELAEHALTAAERALDQVDDSDGGMSVVIERLEELHYDACRRARPDPVDLAQTLFARELEGNWDVFDRAAVRYRNILGEAGLDRYRELAAERWATVPQLLSGDEEGRWSGERFRITRMMETLAELSGGLDEQIAVRERDLSIGYHFLEIAELCRTHGEHDAALEWALRGIAEFPERPDPRLRSFLIDEYRRREQPADALEHSLAAFEARPQLETYRELATDAKALGQWEQRRKQALAHLREAPVQHAAAHDPRLRGYGWTQLVRVFIWEGDLDSAWQAAKEGGCTPALWLELADVRRESHPNDALDVYQRHVEDVISRKDKRAYAEAVRVIDDTIRALFAESERSEEFPQYVDDVRTTHKAKRNLMKLVNELDVAETKSS